MERAIDFGIGQLLFLGAQVGEREGHLHGAATGEVQDILGCRAIVAKDQRAFVGAVRR